MPHFIEIVFLYSKRVKSKEIRVKSSGRNQLPLLFIILFQLDNALDLKLRKDEKKMSNYFCLHIQI